MRRSRNRSTKPTRKSATPSSRGRVTLVPVLGNVNVVVSTSGPGVGGAAPSAVVVRVVTVLITSGTRTTVVVGVVIFGAPVLVGDKAVVVVPRVVVVGPGVVVVGVAAVVVGPRVVGVAVVVVGATLVVVGPRVVVVVGPRVVVVVGGGATVQDGTDTVFVSIVTAPVRAKARPRMDVPVVRVIDASAKIVPRKVVPVPRVAELPTFQKTLQDCAPPMRATLLFVAVVNVDPAWRMNTEFGSPFPSNVSVPFNASVAPP